MNKTQREPKLRSLSARFTTNTSISSSIFRLYSVAFYRLRFIRPLNDAKFAGLLATFIYSQFNVICQQKTVLNDDWLFRSVFHNGKHTHMHTNKETISVSLENTYKYSIIG